MFSVRPCHGSSQASLDYFLTHAYRYRLLQVGNTEHVGILSCWSKFLSLDLFLCTYFITFQVCDECFQCCSCIRVSVLIFHSPSFLWTHTRAPSRFTSSGKDLLVESSVGFCSSCDLRQRFVLSFLVPLHATEVIILSVIYYFFLPSFPKLTIVDGNCCTSIPSFHCKDKNTELLHLYLTFPLSPSPIYHCFLLSPTLVSFILLSAIAFNILYRLSLTRNLFH